MVTTVLYYVVSCGGVLYTKKDFFFVLYLVFDCTMDVDTCNMNKCSDTDSDSVLIISLRVYYGIL